MDGWERSWVHNRLLHGASLSTMEAGLGGGGIPGIAYSIGSGRGSIDREKNAQEEERTSLHDVRESEDTPSGTRRPWERHGRIWVRRSTTSFTKIRWRHLVSIIPVLYYIKQSHVAPFLLCIHQTICLRSIV